jgi:hypothetical protein
MGRTGVCSGFGCRALSVAMLTRLRREQECSSLSVDSRTYSVNAINLGCPKILTRTMSGVTMSSRSLVAMY